MATEGTDGPAEQADRRPDGGGPTTVVVGDSVAWGQGLAHTQKYASVFQDRVTGGSTSLPRSAIKAHSGAVIGTAGGPESHDVTQTLSTGDRLSSTSRQGRHEFPSGPVPVHGQVDRLPLDYHDSERPPELHPTVAYPDDTSVDVVLVTAGINDIGAGTVASPLGGPPAIESAIEESCYDRMGDLLDRVQRRFPDATVIVTGYHLFLSLGPDGSDVVVDEGVAGALAGIFGLTGSAGAAALSALFGVVDVAESRAAASVEYFYRQSTHYLRKAVSEANGVGPPREILFASPAFDRENAAHAADPWNWPVASMGRDDVAAERRAVCAAMADLDSGVSYCSVAPSLHPNPAGADAMGRAIAARYDEATGPRSVRAAADKLAGGGDEATSIRTAFERYSGEDDLLDPAAGLRTCLNQTVVDSLRVVIDTDEGWNDGNQSASVSLDLGGFSTELDRSVTQRPFDHTNFKTGSTDDFTIDPTFETERTARNPLRLWEVTQTVLEQDQGDIGEWLNSQRWAVESVTLFVNGVKVLDGGPGTLTGDDQWAFDYPVSSDD